MATGIKGRNMSKAISIVPPSVDLSVEIAITFPIHATGRISLRIGRCKRYAVREKHYSIAINRTHVEQFACMHAYIHTYLDQNK